MRNKTMKNKIKVLIVDDEEIVIRGIKKGLEFNDFVVHAVIGGRHAIDKIKGDFFDIVLVDLVMPGMNGVETCIEIKKISPKTEVLLLSGYPQEIEKLQSSFIDAGGKDLFLRKPLLADEVKDAIYKVLKEI